MINYRLKGKVAIVTGGANGIGKAIAKQLAHCGAIVHILDIDAEGGLSLVNQISHHDGQAFFHDIDLTDHDLVGVLFQKIYDLSGGLHILVNNAGIAHIGNVETTTPKALNRLFQVNIKAVYSCLHFGVPLMKQSGGGSIINMASIASLRGLEDRFGYSFTKGAVYTMTLTVAKDYLQDGIRCNAIGPARIHTPLVDGYLKTYYPGKETEMYDVLSKTQPIGRMGKPEEVANLVAFLCAEESSFLTGCFYPVDGGFMNLNT